ncbi:hypothetical protein ACFQ51_51720 [Streptomyces kaempferi]
MTTLSVPLGSAVPGVPIWVAAVGAAALVAIVLLCAVVAVAALNRTERADVAQTLLGLSHVISASSGLLPWGRPSSLPALLASSVPAPAPVAKSAGQEQPVRAQGPLIVVVPVPAAASKEADQTVSR